jgi:hypothetical protein
MLIEIRAAAYLVAAVLFFSGGLYTGCKTAESNLTKTSAALDKLGPREALFLECLRNQSGKQESGQNPRNCDPAQTAISEGWQIENRSKIWTFCDTLAEEKRRECRDFMRR